MEHSTLTPFWGPQTSYLNFCEEDYVITRYIAEFINTLSSFVYSALVKASSSLLGRLPYDPKVSHPNVYVSLHILNGSDRLSHVAENPADELSMHLLTTPLLYRILSFQTSPERTRMVGIILTLLFTVVMVVHMVMDEFLLHAVTFGTAVYLIATRTLKIIPRQIPDPVTRKNIQSVSLFGCASFIFGYLVWLIDEWACRVLTSTRQAVGLPLAFLFELHGWWHVFTAIGGYIAVAIIDLLTSDEVRNDSTEHLAWPIPVIARLTAGGTGSARKDK
ncbi:Ceramidase [Aspergillus parasiticus SU-1]|uniref:Ceramidase n=1 Tax=Aspergillus parasiticus (strain ATCC 56775 / NRRL 5862 / SRRC 143 / SU-1) TaxID=1403190 RepID=A0A0F0IIB1_ASPPU|nr:Ceramidase [Aspergillus parasiticus SU-1]